MHFCLLNYLFLGLHIYFIIVLCASLGFLLKDRLHVLNVNLSFLVFFFV